MNIKFISYTGKYPNLCSGILTIEIDGKEYRFGADENTYDFKTNKYKENCFPQFWVSSGTIEMRKDSNGNMDMWASKGEWDINGYWSVERYDECPKWIIDLLPKLIKIFNENVPQGCCGGCI